MTTGYYVLAVLWLACTAFLTWFIYRQLPTVVQDLAVGFTASALALAHWWTS
jgi:hypothetical protein